MKFEREIAVAVRPERVWAFLWDVDRLVRCLPGCKEVRTIVPHETYEATVSERVGPFNVQFPFEIQVLEAKAPRRLKAQASGRDPAMGSTLNVSLDLVVEGEGAGSRLVIASDVAILGTLGMLGQGIIQQQVDGIITQFAAAIRRELAADPGAP